MTSRRTSLVVPLLTALAVGGVLSAHVLGRVGLGLLVAAAALVAVGVLAAALRGPTWVGVALLALAVGTATWNGLTVGGLQIAHGALALATLVLTAVAVQRDRPLAVPLWVLPLPAAVLLVTCATEVWPTADSYVQRRVQVPIPDAIAATLPSWPEANLLGAIGWLAAAAVLPLAMCLALPGRPGLAARLADLWALGVTVSAGVAVSDELGVTRISAGLLPLVDIGGRQAGLGAQPNHLAVAIALVAPVVTWRVLSTPTVGRRGLWLACGAVLAAGLLSSGSRGGLVGAAAAVGLTLVVLPAGRRVILPGVGLLVGTVAVAVAVAPDKLLRLAEAVRLTGGSTARTSNSERAGAAAQALIDFAHSPVHGVGLAVVADGHSIYLQLLASGGLLLAAGFALAVVGCVLDARVLARRLGELPGVLLVAVMVWLLVGVVENQLTDVYLYVPFALLAGLRMLPGAAAEAAPAAQRAVSLTGGPA